MADSATDDFRFPKSYGFPPMWTLQRTLATRHEQFKRWSSLILAYCHHHRIWRLTLVDALNTPLFRNPRLRKSLTLEEVTEVLDWMTQEQGMRRVEWIGREGAKGSAWIYWRRPEEWADVINAWVGAGDDVLYKAATDCIYRSSRLVRRTSF